VAKAKIFIMALHDTKNDSKNDSKTDCEIEDVKYPNVPGLKVDAHGIPLVPQPSDHKDDPLVCYLSQPLECTLSANFTYRTGCPCINTMYSSYYASLRSLCSVSRSSIHVLFAQQLTSQQLVLEWFPQRLAH
jgi:hypothetical protein